MYLLYLFLFFTAGGYGTDINPLPPSDAVRQQKKIFLRIFSVQYCLNLKNITPLETLNFII